MKVDYTVNQTVDIRQQRLRRIGIILDRFCRPNVRCIHFLGPLPEGAALFRELWHPVHKNVSRECAFVLEKVKFGWSRLTHRINETHPDVDSFLETRVSYRRVQFLDETIIKNAALAS